MNRFTWDLRYPRAEDFPGLVLWGGLPAPRAVPGVYHARLQVGAKEQVVPFKVLPDPRASATVPDMQEQFEFLVEVRDKLTAMHRGIKKLRDARDQLKIIVKKLDEKKHADAIKSANSMIGKMTAVEEALHQTKAQSGQDVLNFPIRLNNKLASLAGNVASGDNRPTDQALAVKKELFAAADVQLGKLNEIWHKEVPQFNQMLDKLQVPALSVAEAP
jgi:hypothetical protein